MRIIAQNKHRHNAIIFNSKREKSIVKLKDLKLSLELEDKSIIQCASFQIVKNNRLESHACISTQAGCRFGCRFCTSGRSGFQRNLSEYEIYKELEIIAEKSGVEKFDCIVFMGIGEPLDNYANVVGCIKKLIGRKRLYSGARRMALATIGFPNMLDKLKKEKLPIDLWISLHAADDAKRKEIMPVAHNYSIKKLLLSVKKYSSKIGKPIWVNYMLFKKFNDTDNDVKNLVKILRGNEKYFNFVITEPNNNLKRFKKAGLNDLLKFKARLKKEGLKNRIEIFVTRGKSISAGCGEFLFTPSNLKQHRTNQE